MVARTLRRPVAPSSVRAAPRGHRCYCWIPPRLPRNGSASRSRRALPP